MTSADNGTARDRAPPGADDRFAIFWRSEASPRAGAASDRGWSRAVPALERVYAS